MILINRSDSLIVTFLALDAADIGHRYTVHLAIFNICMELLVNAVELVAGAVCVEVDLGLPVTVDTPAHAQFRKLFHFIHFSDLTMAGLALYIAGSYVLRVIEVNMVGQVMDLYP